METGCAALKILQQDVIGCRRCPRLVEHCRQVAVVKRRAYRDWDYLGKPVPSFGDPEAWLLIVGLAPGAHGANRTGRMFTGDRSGTFSMACCTGRVRCPGRERFARRRHGVARRLHYGGG